MVVISESGPLFRHGSELDLNSQCITNSALWAYAFAFHRIGYGGGTSIIWWLQSYKTNLLLPLSHICRAGFFKSPARSLLDANDISYSDRIEVSIIQPLKNTVLFSLVTVIVTICEQIIYFCKCSNTNHTIKHWCLCFLYMRILTQMIY